MDNTATTQRNREDKVKRKERVRGPKLAILVKRANGVPFVEGLRMAEEKGLVIASHARLDKALNETGEWKSISDVFACWSGTMTGYEKPGKKLGKSIVYTDPETKQRYVFSVPEDYKGAKNAILAVEHPDYTLDKDGKDLVVAVKNIENISLVENFPTSDGWYLTDEKHGIPTGDQVDPSNDDARRLWRVDDGSRVGPVARSFDCFVFDYRRFVYLYDRPSYGLGVAVEAPAGSAPKIEAVPSQVSSVQEENGVLVKGVSVDEFKALVGNARSSLENLSQMVKDEHLEPLLKLVETLKIKE